MDRRMALSAAGLATAALLIVMIGLAAVSDAGFLGFGGGRSQLHTVAPVTPPAVPPAAGAVAPVDPQVVMQVQDVYDQVVVAIPDPTATALPVEAAATSPTAAPALRSMTTTTATTQPSRTTSTTTAQGDRPPGVPADWPAGKPIPPMPPNCKHPQLEDNGVWNCEH